MKYINNKILCLKEEEIPSIFKRMDETRSYHPKKLSQAQKGKLYIIWHVCFRKQRPLGQFVLRKHGLAVDMQHSPSWLMLYVPK